MDVSGHASAGELLYCYNILGPANVIPVHGEYRHLHAAAQLAIDTGLPRERAFVGENGTVWDLRDHEVRVAGQLEIGFVYVDGSSVGRIDEADLKDRRILAEEGFISIFIALEPQTGKVIVRACATSTSTSRSCDARSGAGSARASAAAP